MEDGLHKTFTGMFLIVSLYLLIQNHIGEGTICNRITNENRTYTIYKVTSRPLPLSAKVGDLAILFEGSSVSGFYCDESLVWIEDTGIRAGYHDGAKLIHFPEKKWNAWVLNGPPGAIKWEKGCIARQRVRRKRNKRVRESSTPTAVDQDEEFGKSKWLGQDNE
jgi:hypothetical protein